MHEPSRRPGTRAIFGFAVLLAVLATVLMPPGAVAAATDQIAATTAPASTAVPNQAAAGIMQFEETVWVINTGSTVAEGVRVELPLLADTSSSGQEIIDARYSIEPQEIRLLPNGNRIGVFYLETIAPGERVPVLHAYTVRTRAANDHPPAGDDAALTPDELAPYLAPANKIESNAPQIQAIARTVSPAGRTLHAAQTKTVARAAADYVADTLTFNASAASAHRGALAGLQAGAGVCEEYATLFVAILRAAGIPARIVNGFASQSLSLAEYDTPVKLLGRRHQWAEFYVEGEGWIPIDPMLAGSERSLHDGPLPGQYVAQNYGDMPVKVRHTGGRIAGVFEHRITSGY